jgi:hypothetical protein
MCCAGSLTQVSAGQAGVWGVNRENQIYYREGTYNNTETMGANWQLVSQLTVEGWVGEGDGG